MNTVKYRIYGKLEEELKEYLSPSGFVPEWTREEAREKAREYLIKRYPIATARMDFDSVREDLERILDDYERTKLIRSIQVALHLDPDIDIDSAISFCNENGLTSTEDQDRVLVPLYGDCYKGYTKIY